MEKGVSLGWNRGVLLGKCLLVLASGLWALWGPWVPGARAGGMGGEASGIGEADYGQRQGASQYSYPIDYLNHPYPFTPKYVWRAMFPGIQERIDAERHAIGVGGKAVQELTFYREAAEHPNQVYHDVGRVIDTGIHYMGGGWTRLDTTKGVVKVYNPRYDPVVSAVAPANKAIVTAVEEDLEIELGREAPGYYNANGHQVAKGDPSAVRFVGSARHRR